MARHDVIVEFSPGSVPVSTSRTWIDISTRVLDLSWTVGRQRDLDDWPPGDATVVLDNFDRLFDPEYAAGTYFGDLLPRVPFRIRTTPDNVVFTDQFYGFVQNGWEQSFSGPASGTCTVRLVDLLSVLQGYTLPSVYDVEVLADNPVAYWPLDETRGIAMRDATGNFPDGEYIPGTTSLSSDEESETGAVVRGFQLDESHWGSLREASAAITTLPLTFEAVFRLVDDLDPTLPNFAKSILRMGTGNPAEGATIGMNYFPADTNNLMWQLNGTSRISSGNNRAFGNKHGLGAEETAKVRHAAYRHPSGGTSRLYLDGVDDTDLALSDNVIGGLAAAPGIVIGSADYLSSGATNVAWPSFLSGVAIYDTDIGTARIEAHVDALLNPLNGLRSDEQIAWALDQIDVPVGLRSLDQGVALMGPADTKGVDALEFMREVTATEQGSFYVAHHDGGKLRFRNRYGNYTDTRSTTSQATVSDDPAAAASTVVRCEPDGLVVEANGIDTVINQTTVKWAGGEEIATDVASVSSYGPRGRTVNSRSSSSAIARGLAQWVNAQYAQPTTRIRGVGFDLGAVDEAHDQVLDLRVGDMVAYRSQPLAVGTAIQQDLLIEGITHTVEGMSWDVNLFVSLAPAGADGVSLFILGTSELDSTDVLGF